MAPRSTCNASALILLAYLCLSACEGKTGTPRIAIVGAGIGGTSAAYFAHQAFSGNVKIDIYESNKIGGRMASVKIHDNVYEAGGAILHPKNKYMVSFTEELGLKQQKATDGAFALFDDKGKLFESSSWTAITMAKLLWRYGLDVYNVQKWIQSDLLAKFERIYDLQDRGFSYTTVEDILGAMDERFVNMTKLTLRDVMLEAGFSARFIDELVTGGLRSNYGQTANVHGFVGSVSTAGIDRGLWRVKGGNQQVPEKLVKASKATLLQKQVVAISLQKDEDGSVSFELRYQSPKTKKEDAREYDFVIVANPLSAQKDPIEFEDFPQEIRIPDQPFHTTVAMFVEAQPNATFFGLDLDSFPTQILTTSADVFFNSVGLQKNPQPVNEDKQKRKVYKVFFNQVPKQQQIDSLFPSRSELRLITWQAYPEYTPGMELPPFVLYDNLFYVNAIESAASAMEMSAIGGRNAALLAYNNWHGLLDKIDEVPDLSDDEEKKIEL